MTSLSQHVATHPHPTRHLEARPVGVRQLLGLLVVVSTMLYVGSDLLEIAQGGFSTMRLVLTYAGEACIPLFMPGLYAVQRPKIGRTGLIGAALLTYAYVFFTSTVVYALVAGTPDYRAVTHAFGAWMTVHGAVLVIGGLTFGVAVLRARVLPRWTGPTLMAGVVLVAAAAGLGNIPRTLAEAVLAAAFIGMGTSLLRPESPRCS